MKNLMPIALIFSVIFLSGVEVPAQDAGATQNTEVQPEVIMAVINGRVRTRPSLQSQIIMESKIGTKFTTIEEKGGWTKVKVTDNEQNTGWISNTIVEKYQPTQPGIQAERIVAKYFKRKQVRFGAARQLFEYLPGAADAAKTYETGGKLRMLSLKALGMALKAVPFNRAEVSPYKEFLAKHSDEVVYSEPAGEWYVRSAKYWELHQKYRKYKIGERIAWAAAANPLPGECEGYINCYLYMLRATQGEYLNFYPSGRYSKRALANINAMLQPIVSDVRTKSVYYTTSDVSDRAEFNQMLSELRKIVSKVPFVEKQEVLKQISQIAEGYR